MTWNWRDGKMIQPVRSLATLQENSSWVPNTHAVTITPVVTVLSTGSGDPSSFLFWP